MGPSLEHMKMIKYSIEVRLYHGWLDVDRVAFCGENYWPSRLTAEAALEMLQQANPDVLYRIRKVKVS